MNARGKGPVSSEREKTAGFNAGREDGSITVESTMAVSLILMILGLFTAFSFYLHDRIVLADAAESVKEELRVFLEEPVDIHGRLDPARIVGRPADISGALSYFQAEGLRRSSRSMMASEAVSFQISVTDGVLLVQAQARFGMEGLLQFFADEPESRMAVSAAVPIREQPEKRLINRE